MDEFKEAIFNSDSSAKTFFRASLQKDALSNSFSAELEGLEQKKKGLRLEKYFAGHIGSPNREYSVRQLIDRVADTIAEWGAISGYFTNFKDSQIFNEELKALLVNQKGSFNYPVWFNVGIEKKPQCSACFILSVSDDKESI